MIAVTGHRDLCPADAESAHDRVRHLLFGLAAAYPSTRVSVLSALAEGADRLAARIALDLGITLTAVLPMPPDEYARDFSDSASVREFEKLRASASRWLVVPGEEYSRPNCYSRVGMYQVQQCHLLVALWDGAADRGPGGTADVVRLQLESTRFGDLGIVCQVVLSRLSGPPAERGHPGVRWLMKGAAEMDAEAEFRRRCLHLDRLNRLLPAS